MKKILILLFMLIFEISYSLEKVKVTILSDESGPPLSFSEDGKAVGIYVDIIKESVKALKDYDITISPVPWKRGLKEVEAGNSIALFPPYKIASRTFLSPYSEKIFTEKVSLFCSNKLSFKNPTFPASFKNLKIATNAGYLISDEFETAKKEKIFSVEEGVDSLTNIMRLYDNRVDCFASEENNIFYNFKLLNKKNNLKNEMNFSKVLTIKEQEAFIGFAANDKKFPFKNDLIKKLNKEILKTTHNKKLISTITDKYLKD